MTGLPPEPTYPGSLMDLANRVTSLIEIVAIARSDAFHAEMAAPAALKPDLRRIGDDLDVIGELLIEKVQEAVQHLAQDEAGSAG